MDPKDLLELQKLKEQKDADLDQFEHLIDFTVPETVPEEPKKDPENFIAEEPEPIPTAPDPAAPQKDTTIKFEPVASFDAVELSATQEEEPEPRKSRRDELEEAKRKKKKIRNIILISVGSALALFAILAGIFFAVRSSNKKVMNAPYWGNGILIENGVKHYSFLGKIKDLCGYDEIGNLTEKAEFDRNGNSIKESKFNAAGTVEYYYIHEYDGTTRTRTLKYLEGQLTELTIYEEPKDNSVRSVTTYVSEGNRTVTAVLQLTENGNIGSRKIYSNEDGSLLSDSQYDGDLIAETDEYGENNVLTKKTVYHYNNRKQLQESAEYDGNGGLQNRTVHQYDKNDQLAKSIYYDSTGTILESVTYHYDTNRNPVKEVIYDATGAIKNQTLRAYNAKNLVAKETVLTADGSVLRCTGYEYGDSGYISKEILYNTANTDQVDSYLVYTRNEDGAVRQTERYNAQNILVNRQQFDKDGYTTATNEYSESGILQYSQSLQYTEDKNLKSADTYTYTEDGKQKTHLYEEYNTDKTVMNRITEDFTENTYDRVFITYQNGVAVSKLHYDKTGKTVLEETFNGETRIKETRYQNGVASVTLEYTYRTDGKVQSVTTTDLINMSVIKTEYTYSVQGIVTTELDRDGNNNKIEERTYNRDGTVTSKIEYENNQEARTIRYQYDEKDRVIEERIYSRTGTLNERIVYYYRTDGSSEFRRYNSEGKLIEDSQNPNLNPGNESSEETDQPNSSNPFSSGT